MNARDSATIAIGVGFAIAVGYINTHTDENGIVAGSLLIGAGALGLVQPRGAWRWGLMVGLAVPVGQIIALVLGLRLPYPNNWNSLPITAVAFVPALIGAYGGALVRTLVSEAAGTGNTVGRA